MEDKESQLFREADPNFANKEKYSIIYILGLASKSENI